VPTTLGPVGTGTFGALLLDKAESTAGSAKGPRRMDPFPVSGTFCGLSELLSVIVSVPLNVFWLAGLKSTVTVQDFPAATLAPHVFPLAGTVNEPGMAETLLIVRLEAPVFVSVMVSDFVCVVFTEPKSRLSGTSSTVPLVSVTVALADLVLSVTEVAVAVTVAFAGSAVGAVYVVGVPPAVCAEESEPQVGAVHAVPFCDKLQFTCGVAVGSKLTVASNTTDPAFTGTNADVGDTMTLIARTVMVVVPFCRGSVKETAVIITVKLLGGGTGGAV